jgi:hypothetical protein
MAVVFDKVMTAIAAGFTFAVKPAFFLDMDRSLV